MENTSVCVPGDKVLPYSKMFIPVNTSAPPEPDPVFEISLKLALYILAMVAAVFGNSALILTYTCSTMFRTVSNTFIVNLAVAGLLVALVCMPLEMGEFMTKNWPFGELFCKVKHFTQELVCLVGMLTHMTIAIERFLNIFHPFRAMWSKSTIANGITLTWFLAMATAFPLFFVHNEVQLHWPEDNTIVCACVAIWPEYYRNKLCQSWSPMETAYRSFLVIGMYFAPALFITASYLLSYSKIKNRTFPGSKHLSEMQLKQTLQSYKLYYTIAVVFFICWTPFQLSALWGLHTRKVTVHTKTLETNIIWQYIVTLFADFNSVINPLLIACLSYRFKDVIKESLSFPLVVRDFEDDSGESISIEKIHAQQDAYTEDVQEQNR